MWWKNNKWRVIIPLIIAAILAFAFFLGGNAPDSGTAALPSASVPTEEAAQTAEPDGHEGKNETPTDKKTGKDAYLTDPVPSGKPAPVEPQEAEESGAEHSCTISISCAELLAAPELCEPGVAAVIPKDGWILKPVTVSFAEGESVFDVILRVCRENNIHMEFQSTAGYNSAYIEGIGNLYEFGAGELSGWMYSVNGWFPNYGCSRYQLKDGDSIRWVYSVDSYGGAG